MIWLEVISLYVVMRVMQIFGFFWPFPKLPEPYVERLLIILPLVALLGGRGHLPYLVI